MKVNSTGGFKVTYEGLSCLFIVITLFVAIVLGSVMGIASLFIGLIIGLVVFSSFAIPKYNMERKHDQAMQYMKSYHEWVPVSREAYIKSLCASDIKKYRQFQRTPNYKEWQERWVSDYAWKRTVGHEWERRSLHGLTSDEWSEASRMMVWGMCEADPERFSHLLTYDNISSVPGYSIEQLEDFAKRQARGN